ncbi:MAG: 30S ribosomal protein S6 [Candidatus Nealsonbacteria bacterium]
MKSYQSTYLISSLLSQEEVKSLEERIKSFIIKEEGLINQVNFPVKKWLAYPIKKEKEALIFDLTFNLKPERLENLEKKIKSEKQILRYLILKKKLLKKKVLKTPRRLKIKTKPKVELKEIEKKLEEILGE